jgi:hypothetical protein
MMRAKRAVLYEIAEIIPTHKSASVQGIVEIYLLEPSEEDSRNDMRQHTCPHAQPYIP